MKYTILKQKFEENSKFSCRIKLSWYLGDIAVMGKLHLWFYLQKILIHHVHYEQIYIYLHNIIYSHSLYFSLSWAPNETNFALLMAVKA